MISAPSFTYNVSIYHEDTDIYGMVYHSNYLKYMERARSEMLATKGLNFHNAWQQGIGFVVSSAQLDFKKPARLQDRLSVITRIIEYTRVTLVFEHIIENNTQDILCIGRVKLACINANYRPRRIPEEVLSDN